MKIIRTSILFLSYLFLYFPIVILIIFSFNNAYSVTSWHGFSLRWYHSILVDSRVLTTIQTTVILALLAATISVIIAIISSLTLQSLNPSFEKVILAINNIPIINADIVTGISLMTLFSLFHTSRGFLTLLISHVSFIIPYVMLTLLPRVKQLPKESFEAALDLGANPFQALLRVTIPSLLPVINTSFLFSLLLSIDDFAISYFTTGHGTSNLSTLLYSMTKRGMNPKINAISCLFILIITILTVVLTIRDRKRLYTH